MNDQGIFGGEAVQLLQGGEGRGFVIVPGRDPLARGGLVLFQEEPDPAAHFLHRVRPLQGDLQLGAGHLGEVAVGVDKSGHQGGAVEVHLFALARHGPKVRLRAHRQNLVILHQEGLGVQIFLHGQNVAAVKQCFHDLHLKSFVFP